MSHKIKAKRATDPVLGVAKPPAKPPKAMVAADIAQLNRLPVSYQDLMEFYAPFTEVSPFLLRKETLLRIEMVTNRPLICYVARTNNITPGMPSFIDDSDLTGFHDLSDSTSGDSLDVYITSNGGSAEAAERIVGLLRTRFKDIRFLVPENAYSAATLISLSGNSIVITPTGTLGPIDPQINGVPARTILRAFESLEERLKIEGPKSLTAYMPLIQKYDLHVFEICKSAQKLSEELARNWLSAYMLNCPTNDPRVDKIVESLSNYDILHSHGRGIDGARARELGLQVIASDETPGLSDLLRSLRNQYEMWFDQTQFVKSFENARGISWGRQFQTIQIQLPFSPQTVPQPGPPHPSR